MLVSQMIKEDAQRRERWAYLTEGLVQDHRLIMERLLDQTAKWIAEESTTANVAAFSTWALPVVRRVFAKLIAQDLFSLQPMSQPTGKAFYLDFKYGSGADAGNRIDQLANFNSAYADSSEGGTVKEINFDLSSVTVEAQEKKLKYITTVEALQDLKAYHPTLDGEDELMKVLSAELVREINSILLADALAGATAGNVNWSKTVPSTQPWSLLNPKEYKATIYDAITDANNLIFKKRFRNANWILADPGTCVRLEKLEDFKGVDTADDGILNVSIEYVGTLKGKYRVWKDPWFTANKMLLGYKGTSWLDTGYVYLPYHPLYVTDRIVDPNDFKPRRGIMSRFAKKCVVGDMFATVTLTSS